MWEKTTSQNLGYSKDTLPSPLILSSPFSFLIPIKNTSGIYPSCSELSNGAPTKAKSVLFHAYLKCTSLICGMPQPYQLDCTLILITADTVIRSYIYLWGGLKKKKKGHISRSSSPTVNQIICTEIFIIYISTIQVTQILSWAPVLT